MQVKITDNALARDLFPMDYHCLGDNENRPVRWMALESLLNNDFSSASDVVRNTVNTLYVLQFTFWPWFSVFTIKILTALVSQELVINETFAAGMMQRRWCRKLHQLYSSHSLPGTLSGRCGGELHVSGSSLFPVTGQQAGTVGKLNRSSETTVRPAL